SSGRAVVLVRDEFAVPAQNRIGRHQAAELVQNAATEGFALRREPAALGVGSPSPRTRAARIGAARPTSSAILPRRDLGSAGSAREPQAATHDRSGWVPDPVLAQDGHRGCSCAPVLGADASRCDRCGTTSVLVAATW